MKSGPVGGNVQGGYAPQQQGGVHPSIVPQPLQQPAGAQQQAAFMGGTQQQQPIAGVQPQGFAAQQPASGLPVVDPRYVAASEQLFLIKQKIVSMSGDDMTIQCATTPSLSFKLDASTVTLHGTRKLKEAHGSHVILNVRHKLTSDRKWQIYAGGDDSELIADVHGPGKVTLGTIPHAEVYLNHSTTNSTSTLKSFGRMFKTASGMPDFVVSGDVSAHTFSITHQGQLVGEINRDLVAAAKSSHFSSKDSYALRVLPGQDCAFLVSLVSIVQELFFESKN